MHNPFATWRVTDTWRSGHRAVDYGMDEGVPFGSPAAGIYRHDGPWRDAGIRGVLTLDDGRLILFCHLSAHIAAHGSRVAEGQSLARVGNTGTSGGPHMHTYGLTATGQRWDWTRDLAAAAAAAAAAAIDFITTREDTTMHIVTVSGRHQYAVAREYIAHLTTQAQSDITRKVTSATDEMHKLGDADFYRLLDGLGIPRTVVDLKTGRVVDGVTGQARGGGVWSGDRELRRQVADLAKRLAPK